MNETEPTAPPERYIPIILCEQASVNSAPVLLLPGQPCPWCGEPIADHDTIAADEIVPLTGPRRDGH